MPVINTTVACPVYDSFRVQQVAGMFDVPLAAKATESFEVELPGLDEPWEVGLIVGPSGSGKSTVARHAYEAELYRGGAWPADRAVIDGFGETPVRQVVELFTAVGFSSPPSWVKPYHVLSGGEQFRCDLARALGRVASRSCHVERSPCHVERSETAPCHVERSETSGLPTEPTRTHAGRLPSVDVTGFEHSPCHVEQSETPSAPCHVERSETSGLPTEPTRTHAGRLPPVDVTGFEHSPCHVEQSETSGLPTEPTCTHAGRLPPVDVTGVCGTHAGRLPSVDVTGFEPSPVSLRAPLAVPAAVPRPVVVFDEYTSVVDRQVARACSVAIGKGIRRGAIPVRFVAVTCHYDVAEWLEADWVLDMATGHLQRRRLRRPAIELEIHRCTVAAWRMFARHHYLSGSLAPAARCYLATWQGEPVTFCATLPLIARQRRRRFTRIVTLPDYQGMGIGMRVVAAVAALHRAEGLRVNVTSSHPALIQHCRRSAEWRTVCVRKAGTSRRGRGRFANYRSAVGRSVASFEYVGTC